MRRPAARRPRRVTRVLTALALVAAACADDGPGAAEVTVVAVAARPCDRPLPSEGIGLVIGDGLVVTAGHVVDGPRRDVLVEGRPASVVAVDARTDLAVVVAEVTASAPTFGEPTARHAAVVTPEGELAAEIVRTGTLVVEDLSAGLRHRRQAHTFTPGVSPGTSGAPLVDAADQVLGVVVLDNPTDGTAYAVTAPEVRRFVDRARTFARSGTRSAHTAAADDGHAATPCPG